jgi:cytochrome P450
MAAQRLYPPGLPNDEFFFGQMRHFTRDTLSLLLQAPQVGDFARMKFGPFNGFIASHPDLIHRGLVTEADKFSKSTMLKTTLKSVLGTGLFTSEGDFWKRQRKLAQPAFHPRRIGAYGDVMVRYAAETADGWQNGATLDMDFEMVELTMRIVARTLFDADVKGEAAIVSHAVTTILHIVDKRLNRLLPTPEWLPIEENRRFRAALDDLNGVIQRFIDDRRRTGADTGDLLSMLLLARDDDDSGMTDKQVRDEVMTLFGAGHETTARTMTWAWYALAQNPHVARQLHAELDEVLNRRAPTMDDLPRLKYTEQVIKEVMRLYPPAWAVTREMMADGEFAGYALKKGEVVIFNMYGVQRDPRFWDDPLRFNPDRFSADNEKSIEKYAYLPFGTGARVCIGNAFALMEARLILATIAARFELDVAPGQVVEPMRAFTLVPKYGMRMVARARQPMRVVG